MTHPKDNLGPEDRREFAASLVESEQLLARAERRERTMKNAQVAPPAPPAPNPEADGTAPLTPPAPAPAAPPVDPAMAAPAAPGAPPAAPPVDAAPPAPMAPPPGPGAETAAAPAMPPPAMEPGDGLEDFLEEKKSDTSDPMTSPEMGMKPELGGNLGINAARYAHVYGHLRARRANRGIDIYDPRNGKTLMSIPLRASVMADGQKVRRAAVNVFGYLAANGLGKTAQRCRAKLFTAESVVDYGESNMKGEPGEVGAKDSQEGGDSNLADKPGKPKPDTQKDITTDRKENPEGRSTPGLGGKTASPSPSGGIQSGGESSTKDQPTPPTSTSMDVTKDGKDNLKDDRKNPETNVLEEALNTMSDSQFNRAAQATPPGAPPPAPMGPVAQGGPPAAPVPPPPGAPPMAPEAQLEPEMDPLQANKAASLQTLENNMRTFYANKATKDARRANREFVQKFTRLFRIASMRSALNLEDNALKASMFNSLTREAAISANEDFIPMDERTAAFVIEGGLDAQATVEHINSLLVRTAQLFKLEAAVIAQMEEDLSGLSPAAPNLEVGAQAMTDALAPEGQLGPDGQPLPPGQMAPEGQMGPMDPNMGAPMAQMDMAPPAAPPLGAPPMAPEGQMDMAPPPAPPAPPADPMQAAASRARAAALQGNPGLRSGGAPAAPGGRHDVNALRSALGGTRSASFSHFFNR